MQTQTLQLLKSINAAVSASPELATQLKACQSIDEMAAQLSKALSSPVSAVDLAALEQHSKAEMTDEQLETVAGGFGSYPLPHFAWNEQHRRNQGK